MKTLTLKTLLLALALIAGAHRVAAQGTAFTYQGVLNDQGAPASGSYSLRFILYNAEFGGSQVGPTLTNEPVAVAGGLFTTTLDFGAAVLDGSPRWLEAAVRTNGSPVVHQALSPRQPLTPTPYAFYAANAGTAMSVTGTVSSAVTFNNPANVFAGSFAGNGSGLTGVDAATLAGLTPSNFWRVGGNLGIASNWYVGTVDYQPLELRVNNQRAFRAEPTINGWPNLIGGAPDNYIAADVSGAIVAGGVVNGIADVSGSSSIGGGRNNLIGTYSAGSFIGGGQWNQLGDGSVRSVIGGGYSNQIRGFTSTNAPLVARDITDGTSNTLLLGETVGNATVGGGYGNIIGMDCTAAVISGGLWNLLGDGSVRSFIGGGSSNAVDGTANTIVAGERNQIEGGRHSVLGGGSGNTIRGGTFGATIGGGGNNMIDSLANNTFATIAGGAANRITNAGAATIGGGFAHKIENNAGYATIAGGFANTIETNAGGANIGGGARNTIQSDARRSVIGGGEQNTILANAINAVIAGGSSNVVGGISAAIPGGDRNAALGDYSFAAGRRAKANHAGTFVWADSTNADFASSSSDQFLIRATGGVGIGKTNPAAALDVNGSVRAAMFEGAGGPLMLATVDNQPLEFKVNGQRALRIEPSASPPNLVGAAPNIIGGAPVNFVAPFVSGSTIGGGGGSNYFGLSFTNSIAGNFSTIGGGAANAIGTDLSSATIGGGDANTIQSAASGATIAGGGGNTIQTNANYATIGGGHANTVQTFAGDAVIGGGAGNTIEFSSSHATIPGGLGNLIQFNGQQSTIGGGYYNIIQTNAQVATIGGGSQNIIQNNAVYATIGGGYLNTNSGRQATIPGGKENRAAGENSFAAGFRAKANHAGTFVWADTPSLSATDFASTSSNQFLVRASGGVGINTANPVADLHVNGPVVIQGALTPGPTSSSNLLNLLVSAGSSPVTTNGSLNGISFYESAGSKSMSFGYDGSGATSLNALRIYNNADLPLVTFQHGGSMGIGTPTPATQLHIRDAGAAEISVESSDAGGHRWTLQSSGVSGSPNLDASFQIIDRTSGGARLLIGTNGNVGIGTSNPTNRLHVAGGITCTALVQTSDRHAKENFAPISPRAVLDKVAALPITTWHFKELRDGRHLGPMAQDFYAAFGLGGSETTITALDADGVALAAIQGLNQKFEEQRTELKQKDAKISALEERLAKLEEISTANQR